MIKAYTSETANNNTTIGGKPAVAPTTPASPTPTSPVHGSSASAAAGTGAATSRPGTGPRDTAQQDTQLIDAADRGDATAVRRLLRDGADVVARDERGRTALVAAAYGNHLDAARALVEAGADVNAEDSTQQSAYLIATSEVGDDPRLLERTLAAGADVQAKDSYNGTGLIRAGERGFPRIVDRLLRAGVEVDHVNRLGWTALLEAIILGEGGPAHVETVRLLLAGGANPNLPDREGVTPLAHAQRRGQLPISTLLRDAGART